MFKRADLGVLEFYRGSTVLIAGGTDFFAKTLLEKVLRCLEVRKIYLLIRSKKGCSAKERLKTILKDRLFDEVHLPELTGKIVPVEVDYELAKIRAPPRLASEIQKEVKIVFYCIEIKTTEALKETVDTNVFLAWKIMNWCQTFSQLEAFVYTSTFYCNFDQEVCEEKVNKDLPFGSYEIVNNMMKHLSTEDCEQLKSVILEKFPNTYVFSKRLAEVMIETEFVQKLPVAIYRPPIITPTCREPMLGWTDNPYCTIAYIKSYWDGLGFVKYFNRRAKCDFAPVDYCANAALICAFDVAEKKKFGSDSSVPVYNHHSNTVNTTFGDVISCMADTRKKFLDRMLWKYCWFSTQFYWLLYLNVIIGSIKDFITYWLPGSKPIHKFYYRWSSMWFMAYSHTIKFVTFRTWKSISNNLQRAVRRLSDHEQYILFTDLDEINWNQYLRDHVAGAVKYLERENRRLGK